MSIKFKKVEKKVLNSSPKRNPYQLFEIKIQCPDCLSILTLEKTGNYYCEGCRRYLSENEIRKRCGL